MPGIKDVQVAAVPSKKYGEAVGAFIILQPGAKMEPEDVREFCRGKIARYKIPKYVFFIDEFPLTGSGIKPETLRATGNRSHLKS